MSYRNIPLNYMCVYFMKHENQVKNIRRSLGKHQESEGAAGYKGIKAGFVCPWTTFICYRPIRQVSTGLALNHLCDSGCFNNSEILIMAEALHHQGMDA